MNKSQYQEYRIASLDDRYLPPELLYWILADHFKEWIADSAFCSVAGLPIPVLRLGSGQTRVLLWSQMHGNESTTTRALLDLLIYLRANSSHPANLLDKLQLLVIPMLNPDGAKAYTRVNANAVDLNRDAIDCSQPESKALRENFDSFKPDFCFNLHDQRTIYSVGSTPVPATLSFLAPAADPERTIPDNRRIAMKLIAAIADSLKTDLPGAIARYDDSFNPNCVGDQFQQAGVPTLLFEAGHYSGDYPRDETRYYLFQALLAALNAIATRGFDQYDVGDYYSLPENGKQFADILIHNPGNLQGAYGSLKTLAVQFREELRGSRIHWIPEWLEDGLSDARYGHLELDAAREEDREVIKASRELAALLF